MIDGQQGASDANAAGVSDADAGSLGLSSVPVPQLSTQQMTMLQAFLMNLGYSPGPIDGLWGPKTQAAWLKFAQTNNVSHEAVTSDLWAKVEAGRQEGFTRGPGGQPVADTSGPDGGTGLTITNSPGAGGGDVTNNWEIDGGEEAAIRDQFPSLAYLLDHPEIGPMLRQAVAEGWPPGKLSARIEATTWFQQTSESQRLFDASMARDPATIGQQLDQQEIYIENLFSAYGITADRNTVEGIATDVLRNGLSNEQVLRIVGNHARTQAAGDSGGKLGGSLQGNLSATVQQLQQMAGDYYLKYSEDQLEEMAIRIVEGRWSMDGAMATMRGSATDLYPHLKDRLAEGLTLKDYYAPVKQKLAQSLDMSANDIDLQDARWAPVTQLIDDGKGNYRTMNFTELTAFARNQPEWWETSEASAVSYGTLNTLMRTMGAI